MARRKSLEEKLVRFEVVGECWIWKGPLTRDGYGVFCHGRGRQVRAHRASYQVHFGEIPSGMLVCHKCDTPKCINPSHLFLGTCKDNTQDMHRKGRQGNKFGERHPLAKLSNFDVSEIKRKRVVDKATLAELAASYSVTFQHVSAICLGKVRSLA